MKSHSKNRKAPSSDKTAATFSYSSLTLDMVRKRFRLQVVLERIFNEIPSVASSEHLKTTLRQAADLSLLSEKARSEFIVAPILLEVREHLHHAISIYSGIRLDVSPEEGLQGICDFIITRTPPLPNMQAPLIMMVEAKKNDMEEGLGQCAAEMVAASRLNLEDAPENKRVYGVVTTGELWQFIRLEGATLSIDPAKVYIEHVDLILGILTKMAS